ncbi:hypothetical protein [Methyloligella solikamskensis]|uniref:Uncharacterized protein n=1 Tax=Methyloligella solikamskensis TaxID=1177756 RepID=A0ABW3J7G7_9HYPH
MSDFEVTVTGARRITPNRGRIAIGPALRWLIRPRIKTWLLLVIISLGLIYGTPHLMIAYRCHKAYGQCVTYSDCRYIGIQGWRHGRPVNGQCSYVRIMPIDWH